jgi:hypothetical protein
VAQDRAVPVSRLGGPPPTIDEKQVSLMVSSATAGTRSFRLGARTRKAVLVVHIVSAGAWFGIDVVMGLLIFTSILTADVGTRALCYQALGLFVVWPLFTVGALCLASGVVLGLGSKYGLVRYWWVAVKLALNLVLTALVLLSLRPGVAELSEVGRQLATGERMVAGPGDMVFPPTVSVTALLVAMVLSVFKPWGLIRKRPAARPETRAGTAGGQPVGGRASR